MTLRKSESGSRKSVNIDKLIEGYTIEDIDEQDAKMAYLAYRLDQLPWKAKQGIRPSGFMKTLSDFVLSNYDLAWSVRNNSEPVCIVFGISEQFTLVGDVIWHPGATPRSKISSAARFVKDTPVVIRTTPEYKKFYERLMDYGLLRRVGKLFKDKIEHVEYQSKCQV